MQDTSMTHKKKNRSIGMMMRPPKNESDFISGMTRVLNRRVRLNSDQVDKVHQVLTDYFSIAHSNINNVNNTTGSLQTDTNGQIFVGTHNPVDTSSYVSPYASLNHSSGMTNTYGSTSGSRSDTSSMSNQQAGARSYSGTDSTNIHSGNSNYSGIDSSSRYNQRAGARSYSGTDSTGQNNNSGGMGNNTAGRDVTSTNSGMNSGSISMTDKSEELDQAGLKVEKQIESILNDDQNTRFASFKDTYIDLLRQQALTVKSE